MRERFDVFVSYSHADSVAVGRLVAALEAQDLAVYRDLQENVDFASICGSVERALGQSKALLAYYSKSYPASRACQWELTAAFLAAQRHGDPRWRVLVVNPEAGIAHIQPVELRDELFRPAPPLDDEQGHVALAGSVAEHVARLDGLLGEVRPLVLSAWHPEQRVGSARFVGRLAEMWELHSALQASGLGMITGAVSAVAQLRGFGGVGKSLLAEEYALRFGAAYPGGIFWLRGFGHGDGSLDAGQREAERERQLEVFAARVGISVAGMSPDDVEGALARWLSRAQSCLWVVDDLPSALDGELGRWLAPHPAAKTLITTLTREYDALGGRLDLGELPESDALDLLTKRRQPQNEEETIAAQVIAEDLGYHALALDVAAAALRYQPFRSFLDALREPGEDWLERLAAQLRDALPNGHERSIARTLARSIERLGEEGLDFLRLASVLAHAPVAQGLVAAVFASADGLDERAAAERSSRALNQAESWSLAEWEGELSWRVHALVSRTVRFTDPVAERRQALRHAAIAILTTEMAAIADPGAHARLTGVVPHARELTLRANDRDSVTLLGWVAKYDYQRGNYHSATTLFERQLDSCRRVFGKKHPNTLSALDDLASAVRMQGDLTRGRKLHEQALKAHRRVFGKKHPNTLAVLSNLAEALRMQGDLAGARKLNEQALKVHRGVLSKEHPFTLTALNNLALTLREQGDLAGARKLQEQALEAYRGVLSNSAFALLRL